MRPSTSSEMLVGESKYQVLLESHFLTLLGDETFRPDPEPGLPSGPCHQPQHTSKAASDDDDDEKPSVSGEYLVAESRLTVTRCKLSLDKTILSPLILAFVDILNCAVCTIRAYTTPQGRQNRLKSLWDLQIQVRPGNSKYFSWSYI